MKMENEVWKPEVGKTAWVIDGHDIIKEVVVVSPYGQVKSYFEIKGWGLLSNRHRNDIHPTAEAALASIKAYDLEGNEVQVVTMEEEFAQFVSSNGEIARAWLEWCGIDHEAVVKRGKEFVDELIEKHRYGGNTERLEVEDDDC